MQTYALYALLLLSLLALGAALRQAVKSTLRYRKLKKALQLKGDIGQTS